ncbi:MAG: hypothetical protein JO106_00145 [Mycobacterium sp.]|nr:hypothetical protein [Mycobacterium sp.]
MSLTPGGADARLAALTAVTRLTGARAARADEPPETLADALSHVERLAYVVEGDVRADGGVTR